MNQAIGDEIKSMQEFKKIKDFNKKNIADKKNELENCIDDILNKYMSPECHITNFACQPTPRATYENIEKIKLMGGQFAYSLKIEKFKNNLIKRYDLILEETQEQKQTGDNENDQ